jgi:hypothetical protein
VSLLTVTRTVASRIIISRIRTDGGLMMPLPSEGRRSYGEGEI